ncbi:hypothetical protein HZI73_09130 [Vallitalea pronyensis]|uniref:Tail specific protease domain-containing protein n=1 Tax=Vallitalea pronyensis TaxID=1348613 RepID=A0A8J8SGJ4_9FIRM|nr:S41 family peptidase [Vallitalea pronyensis]QUI22454.1 hypothetical protein HZI73_09130 [Vallitalea pronyensis]
MKRIMTLMLILMMSLNMYAPAYAKENDQQIENKRLSVKQLHEDFEHLTKTLEEVHPNLYASYGKNKLESQRLNIKKQLSQPMTILEYYTLIAPFISLVQDGHTSIVRPKALINQAIEDSKVFPLVTEIRDNKMYVIGCLENHIILPLGAEITAIEDIHVKEIITTLKKYVVGTRDAYREGQLEEALYDLLWLHYHVEDTFHVTYKWKGKVNHKKITGVSKDMVDRYFKSKFNDQKTYTYRILNNDICYLDINRFKEPYAFEGFLKDMFQTMKDKHIDNLIVDIRDNPGGVDRLGTELISHLYDKPFSQVSRVDIKVSEQTNSAYGKIGDILSQKPKMVFNQHLSNTFDGRLCLLTNRNSFSAASMFASAIKDYHLGIVIGEETGGLATQYGNIYFFNLPHSQLKVCVSSKYIVRPNGEETKRGVQPHYQVTQSVKDRINHQDTVLAFAKDYLYHEYDKEYNQLGYNVGEAFTYIKLDHSDYQTSIEAIYTMYDTYQYDLIYDMLSDDNQKIIPKDMMKAFIDERNKELSQFGGYQKITLSEGWGIKEDETLIRYAFKGYLVYEKKTIPFEILLDETKRIESDKIDI